MIWQAWFTQLWIVLLVVLLILLIIFQSGNSLSIYNTLGTNQVLSLQYSAIEVFFEGSNLGGSEFLMRPRSKGSMVVFWNNTNNIVTLLNTKVGVLTQPTTMGTLTNGELPAQSTTVCVNQNGSSTGTASSSSWLCEEPSVFRV